MLQGLRDLGYGRVAAAFSFVGLAGCCSAWFAEDLSRMSVWMRGPQDGATVGDMRFLGIALVVVAGGSLAVITRDAFRADMSPRLYRAFVVAGLVAYHVQVGAAALALAFFQDALISYTGSPTTIRVVLLAAVVVGQIQVAMEWRTLLRAVRSEA